MTVQNAISFSVPHAHRNIPLCLDGDRRTRTSRPYLCGAYRTKVRTHRGIVASIQRSRGLRRYHIVLRCFFAVSAPSFSNLLHTPPPSHSLTNAGHNIPPFGRATCRTTDWLHGSAPLAHEVGNGAIPCGPVDQVISRRALVLLQRWSPSVRADLASPPHARDKYPTFCTDTGLGLQYLVLSTWRGTTSSALGGPGARIRTGVTAPRIAWVLAQPAPPMRWTG